MCVLQNCALGPSPLRFKAQPYPPIPWGTEDRRKQPRFPGPLRVLVNAGPALCHTGRAHRCFPKRPRASPDLHAQATPSAQLMRAVPSQRGPGWPELLGWGWVRLDMSGQAHLLPLPRGKWKTKDRSIRMKAKLTHAVGRDNPGCLIQPPPQVINTFSPIQYIQPPRQVETQPTCAGSISFGLLRQPWQTGSVWRSHRIAGA